MAPSIVSIATLAALLSPAIPNILAIAQLTAGCTTNSFTVSSWLIEDFESSGTTVRFQALNRATNTSAHLSCQVSRNTSTWQACTSDSSPLFASVQLEAAVARVRINETWVCNDLTPSRPFVISHLVFLIIPDTVVVQAQLCCPRRGFPANYLQYRRLRPLVHRSPLDQVSPQLPLPAEPISSSWTFRSRQGGLRSRVTNTVVGGLFHSAESPKRLRKD